MRRLVHISDTHFGMVDYATIDPLVAAVAEALPDVLIVSGDLTQRARRSQFTEARDFLARLPAPQIVVPGNHDIPLYDLLHRFLCPLSNYRRYISEELEPFYVDEEIAVLGINTARSLTFKNGRISRDQVHRIRRRLSSVGDSVMKILVTHHPLDLPEGGDDHLLVGRAPLAMQALASCGADILLSGHYHTSRTGDTAFRYHIPGYAALVVHAGTATSTRARTEVNTFNLILVDSPEVTVRRMGWDRETGSFRTCGEKRFRQQQGEWVTTESVIQERDLFSC